MVMALKKGKCEKGSKKCCANCSIGKECLKFESEEDDVELMVAPRRRWGIIRRNRNPRSVALPPLLWGRE